MAPTWAVPDLFFMLLACKDIMWHVIEQSTSEYQGELSTFRKVAYQSVPRSAVLKNFNLCFAF